jgi:hypothetical protein
MKALTIAQRKALIASVAPMEFKIVLTPDQVVEYTESAYRELLDNYSRDALLLAGTTELELFVDFAKDEKFRKLLVDAVEYCLEDAMDNVDVDYDDVEDIALAQVVMSELDTMQDVIDEYTKVAKEDEVLEKAMALVKARGFKVSK